MMFFLRRFGERFFSSPFTKPPETKKLKPTYCQIFYNNDHYYLFMLCLTIQYSNQKDDKISFFYMYHDFLLMYRVRETYTDFLTFKDYIENQKLEKLTYDNVIYLIKSNFPIIRHSSMRFICEQQTQLGLLRAWHTQPLQYQSLIIFNIFNHRVINIFGPDNQWMRQLQKLALNKKRGVREKSVAIPLPPPKEN